MDHAFTISSVEDIVVDGTSRQGALNDGWRSGHYKFISTTDCFIEIDDNPTAVAGTSFFVPANIFIDIQIGINERLAVVQEDAGGTAYLSKVA